MSGHNRTVLPWVAYPGTMVMAFLIQLTLYWAGMPIVASAVVAVVLAAGTVTWLEFAIPYDRAWHPNRDDVKNDLLFMVTVQMLLPQVLTFVFGITLLGYLHSRNLTMSQFWPRQLPLVVQVALMLLVAEFFHYWLNVGRFHPLEKALQFLLDALPFILVGVSQEVLAAYFIFYAVNGFFQHSNVDARYGVLNYVVSGAELHRWHHSRLPHESNQNYGNNRIVWDLVFGSWFLPKRRRVGELGLLNRDYPLDFVG